MLGTNWIIKPNLLGTLVESNSIYCGVLLTSIELPEYCHVLGILRNQKVIFANEAPDVRAGDYILAITLHPMMMPALKVTLKKTPSTYYYLLKDGLTNLSLISHPVNFDIS